MHSSYCFRNERLDGVLVFVVIYLSVPVPYTRYSQCWCLPAPSNKHNISHAFPWVFFKTSLFILVQVKTHIIACVCVRPLQWEYFFWNTINVRMDYSFTLIVNPCIPLDYFVIFLSCRAIISKLTNLHFSIASTLHFMCRRIAYLYSERNK
jgi:hypothetical protein